MTDFADFFRSQAEASAPVQFGYDLMAGRVAFGDAAYARVLRRPPR